MDDFDLLRELETYRALVVDDNAIARDVLTFSLRTLGVGEVTAVSRISDARRKLQSSNFDIVLCDYHFGQSETSGQDLLEEVRDQSMLPLASIFVMVTGEASYERVVEVAETAPDDYLLKPFTPDTLLQRLTAITRRKIWLDPIYTALTTGGDAHALAAAEKLVAEGGPHWLYAVRFAAELCVKLGHHERARRLYEQVVAHRAVPWARIGLARTDHAEGRAQAARSTLTTLIEEQPYYVDAYDMLGRLCVEAGDLAQALAVYRDAAGVTPSSLRRLQQFGSLAFMMGEAAEAETALHRAVRLGSGSRGLDPHCVVMLALLKLDSGTALDVERLRGTLTRACVADPDDAYLPLLALVVDCAHALAARQPGRAIELAEALTSEILSEPFDLELACATVALLSRLRQRELDLDNATSWLRDIGLRFIASKNAATLLSGCAKATPDYARVLEEAHAAVNASCNDAMSLVLDSRPQEGVRLLLKPAATHFNGRLLTLIENLSHKHMASDPGSFGRALELVRKLKLRYAA